MRFGTIPSVLEPLHNCQPILEDDGYDDDNEKDGLMPLEECSQCNEAEIDNVSNGQIISEEGKVHKLKLNSFSYYTNKN